MIEVYQQPTAIPENYWNPHEASEMVATGQPKVHAILQWIEPGLVLDLGCNDGGIAHRIQQTGARVIGADRLRYVQIASRDYGIPVVALDADRPLPFADGTFDTVLISGVLECVGVPNALLKEVRRVLVPDGRFILVLANKDSLRERYRRWRGKAPTLWKQFELRALARMLCDSGFSVRASRPCPYKEGGNWRTWITYRLERILPANFATDFAFLCKVSAGTSDSQTERCLPGS